MQIHHLISTGQGFVLSVLSDRVNLFQCDVCVAVQGAGESRRKFLQGVVPHPDLDLFCAVILLLYVILLTQYAVGDDKAS